MRLNYLLRSFVFSFILLGFIACSTSPNVKKQQYATLSNSKDFEEEYSKVWKAIVVATEDMKIVDKDADKGKMETEWIYSTSSEQYVEFKVNGFPRKHYIQSRYKYFISAEKMMGKVQVTVSTKQEIEKMKSDGTFDSWVNADVPDSSRAAELINSIEFKLLSND